MEWFAKLGIIERDLNPRVFFDPLEYTVGCGQPMESLNYGFDDNHLQDFDLDDESCTLENVRFSQEIEQLCKIRKINTGI